MEKLKVGETVVLYDDREFTCFGRVIDNENDYAALINIEEKPVVVKFVKQTIINGELMLDEVEDIEERQKVLNLLQKEIPIDEE